MSAIDSPNIKQEQQSTHAKNNSHYKAHSSQASLSLVPRRARAPGGPTLLDIIKYEEPKQGAGYKEIISNRDQRSWKVFRNKLRLKRAGAVWTSTLGVPASDINLYSQRNNIGTHRNTVRFNLPESSAQDMSQPGDEESSGPKPLLRRVSSRFGSDVHPDESDGVSQSANVPGVPGFKPAISRHNSTRMPSSEEGGGQWEGGWRASTAFGEERQMSAREAAASQEAAEAVTMGEDNDNDNDGGGDEEQPMKMSLMDLMGTGYLMGDEDEDYEDEEEEDDPIEDETETSVEHSCCVCMVRHNGAPSTLCGHTFCRMCSRELMVQKGNCPICNNFILEILDIF